MAKWQPFFLILCASAALCQTEVRPSITATGASGTSGTDEKIESLQLRVKAAPRDYAGYDELGSVFLQKARETGDIAYYDLAEQTLKKSLELMPRDFRAADPLVHIALVCMGEHRFKDALAYAQEAIGLGSGNLPAFARFRRSFPLTKRYSPLS
jgi:tetratricopeptide (TPR) repeat protein